MDDMFPSIPNCAPLEPTDFVLRVLVPEAARLLIMEDMDISAESALLVLQDSRKYGMAKFPDAGGDEDIGMGIGLKARMKVGMERAKKEEEEWREEDKAKKIARQKKKGKGKAGDMSSSGVESTDTESIASTRSTTGKRKEPSRSEVDDLVINLDDDATPRPTKVKPRRLLTATLSATALLSDSVLNVK